jgi:hypothetical protein
MNGANPPEPLARAGSKTAAAKQGRAAGGSAASTPSPILISNSVISIVEKNHLTINNHHLAPRLKKHWVLLRKELRGKYSYHQLIVSLHQADEIESKLILDPPAEHFDHLVYCQDARVMEDTLHTPDDLAAAGGPLKPNAFLYLVMDHTDGRYVGAFVAASNPRDARHQALAQALQTMDRTAAESRLTIEAIFTSSELDAILRQLK